MTTHERVVLADGQEFPKRWLVTIPGDPPIRVEQPFGHPDEVDFNAIRREAGDLFGVAAMCVANIRAYAEFKAGIWNSETAILIIARALLNERQRGKSVHSATETN